jgi:hypothetical protein
MISYEEEIELECTIDIISSAIAIIDIKTLNFATPEEKEISKNLYKIRYDLERGKWEYKDLAAIQEKCKGIINEYKKRPDPPEIQRLKKC